MAAFFYARYCLFCVFFYNRAMQNQEKQGMRLKICGITRIEDALLASELGADALGFVFYEKSPRYINPKDAKKIIQDLPPFISIVGLFVNPTQTCIDETLAICSLDIIQLHGDETADFCSAQQRRVIKALPVSEAKSLEAIAEYDCTVLLDTQAPQDVYGGTGHAFDWSILKGLTHQHPIILAGGIHAENIKQAQQVEGIYALDVSSGVESAKGVKDANKMKTLCELLNP